MLKFGIGRGPRGMVVSLGAVSQFDSVPVAAAAYALAGQTLLETELVAITQATLTTAGQTVTTAADSVNDVTPPLFVSGSANGNTITLTFNEAVQTVDSSGMVIRANGGSNRVMDPALGSGTTTLTGIIAAAVLHTDVVTFEYDPTAANSVLRDLAGNEMAALSATALVNNTPVPVDPGSFTLAGQTVNIPADVTNGISVTNATMTLAGQTVAITEAANPVLSAATSGSTGETAGVIGATNSKTGGLLHGVVTTSSTTPSAAQVKTGLSHTGAAATWYANQSMTTVGMQGFAVTSLSPSTTYYGHLVHNDGSTDSNVLTTPSFTTASPPGSPNLLTAGTNLSNAAWGGPGTTVSNPGAATQAIVETVGGSFHSRFQTVSSGVTASRNYTFSFEAKAGTRSWIMPHVFNGAQDSAAYASFNLSTGALGTQYGTWGTVTMPNTPTITALDNGYYRCELTLLLDSSTSMLAALYIATGDGANSYAGNGTGSILIRNEVKLTATGGIPSKGAFTDFMLQIRIKESSNNYTAANQFGARGAYQFHEAALKQIGWYSDSTGQSNPGDDWIGTFTTLSGIPGQNINDWLNTANGHISQDNAFRAWCDSNWANAGAQGMTAYVGTVIRGRIVSATGILGGMHLWGLTATKQYLTTGGTYNPADPFGTTIDDYFELFNGYTSPYSPDIF